MSDGTNELAVWDGSASDASFILSLQDKHRRELGWLTPVAIGEYLSRGVVTVGRLNNDRAAYLLGDAGGQRRPDTCRIVQACVQYDARHRRLGKAVVEAYLRRLPLWINHCTLWCASDLEANEFWQACGFRAVAVRAGSRRNGRTHILWHRQLAFGERVRPFTPPPATGGEQSRNAGPVTLIPPEVPWSQFVTEYNALTLKRLNALPGSALKAPSSSTLPLPQRSAEPPKRCKRSTVIEPPPAGTVLMISGGVVRRVSKERFLAPHA
jgi:hypothetical protein